MCEQLREKWKLEDTEINVPVVKFLSYTGSSSRRWNLPRYHLFAKAPLGTWEIPVPDQGRSSIFHPNPEAWKAGLFLCLTHLSSPTGIDHEVTETCKHPYGGKTAVSTKALL